MAWAVWLSGLVSFELAVEILQRIGQVSLPLSTTWRATQAWGARLGQVEEQARTAATALPRRAAPSSGLEPPVGRMGVALDGAMVHIRDEGFKEFKLGSTFRVETRPTKNRESGAWEERAHAVDNTYVAHLGEAEVLGAMAWADAQQRHWAQAADTIVLGDGAVWVWNQARDHFFDAHQLVDWYHAVEHLALAAHALYPADAAAAARWLAQRQTDLYQGQAATIATELTRVAERQPDRAEEVLKRATYFSTHQRRMNYQEMRENDWPIGSGMVESAAKQFKARLSGPGMRWSRDGATHMLSLRSAILSKRFDTRWLAARSISPQA